MSTKTWLKIKRGLLESEHRERMGVRVWLYMYMLDIVNWETGTIEEWTDKDAAEDFGMEFRTLQTQRQQLEKDGYITCEQGFQCQRIIIHNWTNPREYSGEVYNEKPQERASDNEENAHGTVPDVTPAEHGTRKRVPIRTEKRVPLLYDSHLNHIDSPDGARCVPSQAVEDLEHLETVFAQERGVPLPDWGEDEPDKQKADKKARAAQATWRTPLKTILTQCHSLEEAEEVVIAAIKHMQADRLTFTKPVQILETALSVKADRRNGKARIDPDNPPYIEIY